MRTVTIDMSVDQQHPICSFGGYAGENKETKLVVILPERMLKDTYRKYRFDFQTILNEQISSTMIDRENLQGGNAVQVILWNQLMPQDGDLKFCVSAFEAAADGGDDVVVQGKTALITLKIGKSVGGAYTPIDVKANADELQTMIQDTIDEAISGKQDTLVSGTNIKTIKGSSVLGSGDLSVSDFTEYTGTTLDILSENLTKGLYIAKNAITLLNTPVDPPGNTYSIPINSHFIISYDGNLYRSIQCLDTAFYPDVSFFGFKDVLCAEFDNGWKVTAFTSMNALYKAINDIPVITVDDALSATSTNPVQNKVVKSALDSKLEVKKLTVTDNTLSRAQLAALDAGIYEVDLTPPETGIPALAVGVNELISPGETGPKTIYCYSGTNTVKIKVERYFQDAGLSFSLRISSDCFCMSYDPYVSGVFQVIELANDIISPHVPDKLTDFVTTDTLSNYQQKDYVGSNLATTSPALSLRASIQNSIYQYSNVLTSLTITVPTTPINLDQSIRLIFKATSSTTITVPSGLYFRGDDCNDSYVFIPQDNKVYDIIITYDGFNYNGIVVGTPATR